MSNVILEPIKTNEYSQRLAELKARPACKLKEIGDQWRTPERLYIGINAKFGPFTLDLFTDGDNSKCANFYTAEQNALLQDWASDLKKFGGSAFANPPYSRESKDNNGEYVTGMRHIIDKVLAERDAGARIVFLIKATPSETWWPEEADHIVFIKGRIGFDVPEWFVPEEGSATKAGAGFASAVAIFDKNWRGEKMSYISRDELEFIGQHWLDAVDAKARQLVAAQLEATRAAEPAQEAAQELEEVACPKCGATCRDFTAEADFIGWHGHCASCELDNAAPSMVVEPEAKTIEPEPEPDAEQPARVASVEDCVSEEQETAQEVAEAPADELPTQRAEIDDLRVLAALDAAFGIKNEYLFSESRVAHTWVADSFDHPTIIIVPADVLTRATSLYRRYQGVELIDGSGCSESQIERLHAVSEDVLSGYSEWFIPVMRELIERVKESGLENIREMRVEMRLIAERLMREFFNPRSGAPSLGCSEDQIQGLRDVLWEVEHGYFGPFDKSDLMPVFNQLVGYVRATNPAHARKMRLYLRSSTKINGHVIHPEQVESVGN